MARARQSVFLELPKIHKSPNKIATNNRIKSPQTTEKSLKACDY